MLNNTPFTMPVAPANGNGNSGMFGGDGWWAIIIFAIIFGWGGFGGFGGGYSGGQGSAVDGYVLASDFAQVESKLDSVNNGICSLGYDQLAQMNGINQNVSNVGYNLQSAITTSGYETRNAIQQNAIADMQSANALQSQIANCCCENREAIANLNYNMATQACETRQAIADGTKSIIDFLTQDKIATLTAENQRLAFAASQSNQNGLLTSAMAANTAQIINAVNPCPVPAYVVPNPNGCGCNQNPCSTCANWG